jgi:hypothetical protein
LNGAKGPDDQAMAVTAGSKDSHGMQNAGADITCFFCDKKGHFKSNCPEKQAWEKLKKLKDNVDTMATAVLF